MKPSRAALCLAVLAAFSICAGAAAAATDSGQWANLFCREELPPAAELSAVLQIGDGNYTYIDEVLDVEIWAFALSGAGIDGAPTGKAYVSGDAVVGLSTVYLPDHRSGLGRFVLDRYDEILFFGDLAAIAGARENCTEYRAVAVTGEGVEEYRLTAELYERMVAVGDLPPIPEENARKGYAA